MSQQMALVFEADDPVQPVQVSDDPVQRERDEIIAMLDIYADNRCETNQHARWIVGEIQNLIENRGTRYD